MEFCVQVQFCTFCSRGVLTTNGKCQWKPLINCASPNCYCCCIVLCPYKSIIEKCANLIASKISTFRFQYRHITRTTSGRITQLAKTTLNFEKQKCSEVVKRIQLYVFRWDGWLEVLAPRMAFCRSLFLYSFSSVALRNML